MTNEEIKHINNIIHLLKCPISGESLLLDADQDMLYTKDSQLYYPIKNGIPLLLKEEVIDKKNLQNSKQDTSACN